MTLERNGPLDEELRNHGAAPTWPQPLRFDLLQLRIDLLAGNRAQQPGGIDAVVGLQALLDDAQPSFQRPDSAPCAARRYFAVHDQQIASGLIAAERHIRHEQRVLLLIDRDANAAQRIPAASARSELGSTPRTGSVPVDWLSVTAA
jgi:hypothetical protein